MAWSLKVQRGRTEFPLRTIASERFLIGSDPACDLQLGGVGMPALHSIVVLSADGLRIERFADTPVLRVNGHAVVDADLIPGDTLDIGPFEFLVQLATDEAMQEPVPQESPALDETVEDVSALSVPELVKKIEQDERMVANDDARRQLGARALLSLIAQRMPKGEAAAAEVGSERIVSFPGARRNASAGELSAVSLLHLDSLVRLVETTKESLRTDAGGSSIRVVALVDRLDVFARELAELRRGSNSVPPVRRAA